jgi:hypothetical protein
MTNDVLLAAAVRAWVDRELPGDAGAADRAAHIARQAYAQGASVREACEQARAFVGSWVRHPSHAALDVPLPRAS